MLDRERFLLESHPLEKAIVPLSDNSCVVLCENVEDEADEVRMKRCRVAMLWDKVTRISKKHQAGWM